MVSEEKLIVFKWRFDQPTTDPCVSNDSAPTLKSDYSMPHMVSRSDSEQANILIEQIVHKACDTVASLVSDPGVITLIARSISEENLERHDFIANE